MGRFISCRPVSQSDHCYSASIIYTCTQNAGLMQAPSAFKENGIEVGIQSTVSASQVSVYGFEQMTLITEGVLKISIAGLAKATWAGTELVSIHPGRKHLVNVNDHPALPRLKGDKVAKKKKTEEEQVEDFTLFQALKGKAYISLPPRIKAKKAKKVAVRDEKMNDVSSMAD